MSKTFITDDFLLQSEAARTLYHEYAAGMPICDYHCHLPPQQVADDVQFKNMAHIWLYGDHYKWRAMRTNGVAEKYCTGDADDYEKFEKWAQTVPYTIRNPLYHWTHLELLRYFDVDDLLGPDTARRVYDVCSEKLQEPGFSARGLMMRMNVKSCCTTDDPLDSLEHHQRIAADGFEVKVLPTWRPDKAMASENLAALNDWIDRLADLTGLDIKDYDDYRAAIKQRHDFFHAHGCRVSDHGLATVYADDYTEVEIKVIFAKIRQRSELSPSESAQFKSAMLHDLAIMDAEKNWVQQLHLGAQRNNNTRCFQQLGPDTGFDSIGDQRYAAPLGRFLDRLDQIERLPKTIIYNLNPRDNAMIATMLGNFQDGVTPGKIQFGSAWWVLDQKHGMEQQMNDLSAMGLLSRFVGMLTDSRSFLSYPRHEYFRRILCNIIGRDVDNGELPYDMEHLGGIVRDICCNNVEQYLQLEQ